MIESETGQLSSHDLRLTRGNAVVVHGVSFVAKAGQTIGIIGPNGAGKTSLLLALYRAINPQGGEVWLNGTNIADLSRRTIAQHIAVVPQTHEAEMPMSVRDVVTLGRLPHSTLLTYANSGDQALVERALERTALTAMAERNVTELSGGEHQRVLIARAIVQDAPFLLLDEPTNHLDLRHQFDVFRLIKGLACTTVVVLHDLNTAARVCDQLILLDDGRPVAQGAPDEVLDATLISDVYGVVAERISHRGHPHLIFSLPKDPMTEFTQKGNTT